MSFLGLFVEKFRIIGVIMILGIAVLGIVGKLRWQYYPLYLLAVLYFILLLMSFFKGFNLSTRNAKWIFGVGIFLIIISIILYLILPKEKLPIPSGEFKIGTRSFDVEDPSREEFYTEEENDFRKIKYQVWYPTDITEGFKKVKWISDGVVVTRQLARSMYLPAFMLDHTVDIDSNSYSHAPISTVKENYPVVVISHGWSGFRELHTDFAEELASNGFIAVSIDHTYGSQAVKFENGEVALLNEEALPSEANPVKFNGASNRLATTYGEDVALVLDDLEKLNQINPDFRDKLDLEALGVLGHSTGGGGDVYIAIKDKRIKALLGLDAWVAPLKTSVLEKGLSVPTLFLRSEQWSRGPNNIGLNTVMSHSQKATLIQMNQTNHIDFSMAYMYSPITKYIGFTGKLGGRKSSEIQREFILRFFDQNLKHPNEHGTNYLAEIVNKYENLKLIDID